MSNGNTNFFERLFKLWAMVCELVMDDKRNAEELCLLLQAFMEGKRLVEAKPTEELLAGWTKFYRDVFGLELDFSGVKIPERKPGFDHLIVVAQGMTPQRLFDKCVELFPSLKYPDKNLDEIIISDRTAKDGAYAIWVRDRVEADDENKNLSADQLKERGGCEETLEERLLHELKFFNETGQHLDIVNWTLCAGSRYSDGSVPYVNWYDDGLGVSWYDSSGRHGDLRSRSVVS